MSEENNSSGASSDRSKIYLKNKCKNSANSVEIKASKKPQNLSLKAAESGDDGDSKTKSITDLPNEILGKILNQVSFDDLFNLEIVCKRLQKVVKGVVWPMKDSLTHESITQYSNYPRIPSNLKESINLKRHKITIKSVKAVLSRITNIRNLDLSYYSLTLKEEVCSLLSLMTKLIKLDLSNIRLENDDLVTIAHSCPMLEEISLAHCFYYEDKFVDGLKTLCEKCPNIKYMDLARNTLGNFFEFLPLGLLYLNLNDCFWNLNDMNVLAQRVPNLETLILNYRYYGDLTTDVNIWLSKLTKLRFLQIDWVSQPPQSIPSLDLSKLHELEKLRVCKNKLIDLSSLESLQNCKKLVSLHLSYNYSLSRSKPFKMLKKCKALKYCNFSGCSNLNEGLIDFVKHNQIEYLKLDNCGNEITKDLLKSLINDCESLSHLNIWSEAVKYETSLSYILSETLTPPRKNILNIIVHDKNKISSSSSCKWCEVIPRKYRDPSPMPFPDLTDVKIQ